jgi:hypothetical protein
MVQLAAFWQVLPHLWDMLGTSCADYWKLFEVLIEKLLKVCMYLIISVGSSCVCVCVWIITQKIVMWCQIREVRRPQRMTNHWVLKIVLLGDYWIIGCMGSYTILLEEPVFLLLVAWIRKDGVRICAVCTILHFLCLNVLILKAYCTPTVMFCNGTCSVQHKSEEYEPWKKDKLWDNLCVRKFNTFLTGVLADSRNWI